MSYSCLHSHFRPHIQTYIQTQIDISSYGCSRDPRWSTSPRTRSLIRPLCSSIHVQFHTRNSDLYDCINSYSEFKFIHSSIHPHPFIHPRWNNNTIKARSFPNPFFLGSERKKFVAKNSCFVFVCLTWIVKSCMILNLKAYHSQCTILRTCFFLICFVSHFSNRIKFKNQQPWT